MRRLAAVAVADGEQLLLLQRALRRRLPARVPRLEAVVVAVVAGLVVRRALPQRLLPVDKQLLVARLRQQRRMRTRRLVAGAAGHADAAAQPLNPGFPSCPGRQRYTTTIPRTSPSTTRKASVCLPVDHASLPPRTRW